MAERIPGFASLGWAQRRSILLGWDLYASAVLACVAAVFTQDSRLRSVGELAVAAIGVSAALLGVVLAGLAVLVSFLNAEYMQAASKAPGGVEGTFFPFWFTAALAVWSVVMSSFVLVVGDCHSETVARVLLGLTAWPFLWTLFATLNLVPLVAAHGSNRALQSRKERENAANEPGPPPGEGR